MAETVSWDRMKGEGAGWHERFTSYRLLGPERTFAKAAGRAIAPLIWYSQAERWQWYTRATAWDNAVKAAALAADSAERAAEKQGRMTTLKAMRGQLIKKMQALQPGDSWQEIHRGLTAVNDQLRNEEEHG